MRSPRPHIIALLAFALLGGVDEASAAWPNDPGVNVRVAPSASDQTTLLTVDDGAGGTFVIWNETNDVRAQHLTAQGLVAAGWPASGLVVCSATGAQYPDASTPDGAGGFIVVWEDYRGGATADLYAQRVSAAGAAQWTPNGVAVSTATDYQINARICADRTGGAVIAWTDYRTLGSTGIDIYAQRLSSSGAAQWAASGQAVCTATGTQDFVSIVTDGTAGGSFVAWHDARGANQDLYASRLDAAGSLRPGWSANGTSLCTATGDQFSPALASDGAFGAIATWVDARVGSEIYAMRLTSSGPSAPGWPANGVALTNDAFSQSSPVVVADGAGGAIVAWDDPRSGNRDIYAQRVNASGAVAWNASGVPLTSAAGDQYGPVIVPDGAAGAVVGWYDLRTGNPAMIFAQHVTGTGTVAAGFVADGNAIATAHWVQNLVACADGAGGAIFIWQHNTAPQTGYAQHIDRWGYLGAQARIAGVRDVPSDQGGHVKLSWDRSPLDTYPGAVIGSYQVYRSVPPQVALAALARGAVTLVESAARTSDESASRVGLGDHVLLAIPYAGAIYYWEYVSTVAAGQLAGYSSIAPTAQDSVSGSNPRTLFMVRATNAAGTQFWDSDPDSGYSTDNLPPNAVQGLSGIYLAGATHLSWTPNDEQDFASYRLYRGSSAGFVPGPGNLIATQPDTGHADTGLRGSYYKLFAVDLHGNESPVSMLTPETTLDAPSGGAAPRLGLARAVPNPSSIATTCRFSIPAEGPVRLSVHDVVGRLVRVLATGRMTAGEHSVTWRGESDAGGRAPSGLYFLRLTFEGRTVTGKVLRTE